MEGNNENIDNEDDNRARVEGAVEQLKKDLDSDAPNPLHKFIENLFPKLKDVRKQVGSIKSMVGEMAHEAHENAIKLGEQYAALGTPFNDVIVSLYLSLAHVMGQLEGTIENASQKTGEELPFSTSDLLKMGLISQNLGYKHMKHHVANEGGKCPENAFGVDGATDLKSLPTVLGVEHFDEVLHVTRKSE